MCQLNVHVLLGSKVLTLSTYGRCIRKFDLLLELSIEEVQSHIEGEGESKSQRHS